MFYPKRTLIVLASCCVTCVLWARADKAQEKPAEPQASSSALLPDSQSAGYADTNICQSCHQEVWDKHFATTPHASLLKGDQHGCQGCHGPGQAHVDGGGDVTK